MKNLLSSCICATLCFTLNLSAEDGPKPNDLFGADKPAPQGDAAPDAQRRFANREDRNGPDRKMPGNGPSAEDLQAIFSKLDTDADGSVSPEEFSKLIEAQKAFGEDKRAEHEAAILEQFDSNGDGSLDETEKKAAAMAMQKERILKGLEQLKERNPEKYAELDSNSDGTIDDAEFASMQNAQLEKMNERMKQNPEMMARVDKNGDGNIDQEEAMEMRKMMQKREAGDRPQQQKSDRKERKK